MTAGARCELWVESRDGRPAVNPVIHRLLADLAGDGYAVGVRVPEAEPLSTASLSPAPDLVLLKTTTTTAMSWARVGQGMGVRFLNSAAATETAGDKAAVLARLAAAGLPVPVTYLADDPARGERTGADGSANRPQCPPADQPSPDAATIGEGGGWVSKPVHGVHGWGVEFHHSLADASAPPPRRPAPAWVIDDGTRLLQARVGEPDTPDVKVYVANELIFAARKVFSAMSYASDDIAPAALAGGEEEVVRGCGEVLGLSIFGVDLRHHHGIARVIDVNAFPGFRGFPDAVAALRAEIDRALRGGAG